jgi:membrane fusion protein (multidrug efflux system)
MIRLFLFLLISSLLLMNTGCKNENQTNDQSSKAKQVEAYQSQINELKRKISEIESEAGNDTLTNAVNVEVSEVKAQLYEQYIESVGNVATDQNIIVSPETPGIIKSIEVHEGDYVKKGRVLARLNTQSIQKTIEEVEVNLQHASIIYERQKNLWGQNIGSEMEYLQARSNMRALEERLQGLKAQLEMAIIKAPIDGVLDNLMQNQGEMAGLAIPFCRIINLKEVYITTHVSEKYLTNIKAGDSVSVSFPFLDISKKAVIFRTSAMIDPDSRTFSIRVNLDNQEQMLKPNIMGTLKIQIRRIPDAIVVPSLLVKKDFKGEFIFVASEAQNGILMANKKYISTSIKDNNKTVVTAGLNPGMNIITQGFAQVSDGTPLKIN